MFSLNLVSAYFSDAIAEEDRKYLKFEWDGSIVTYTHLPNALSKGPRSFTKLIKPIYYHLHSLGHAITAF